MTQRTDERYAGTPIVGKTCAKFERLGSMRLASVKEIVLAGALASLDVAGAGGKVRARAQVLRQAGAALHSDCDKQHWCRIYACSAGETIVLSFHCNEDSGLCLAPHC